MTKKANISRQNFQFLVVLKKAYYWISTLRNKYLIFNKTKKNSAFSIKNNDRQKGELTCSLNVRMAVE